MLDRLEEEHVVIHGVVESVDRALVELVRRRRLPPASRGRWTCSPTRCCRTCRTRSTRSSSRWPGTILPRPAVR
ncbi:hypothetical protein V2I01_36375 [Micromonospora sp. BRA006-A]|nr:hypothetical protein [Micromonospora sp. BRA006-A]